MSIRKWTLEDKKVQAAKKKFDANQRRLGKNKSLLSFEQLLELHQENVSLVEIARLNGTTKQAEQQRDARYFVPYLGSREKRFARLRASLRAKKKEIERKEKLKAASDTDLFRYLKKAAPRRVGPIRPVLDLGNTGIIRGQNPVFRVGTSSYLRVHRRKALHTLQEKTLQRYVSFQISLSMLNGIDVYCLFVDVPDYPRELLLVRTSFLLALAKIHNEKRSFTYYHAVGSVRHTARTDALDLSEFRDCWGFFDH